jgi:hypothetical protein
MKALDHRDRWSSSNRDELRAENERRKEERQDESSEARKQKRDQVTKSTNHPPSSKLVKNARVDSSSLLFLQ